MTVRTSHIPVPAETPEVPAATDVPTTRPPAGRRRASGLLTRLGLPARGGRPAVLLAAAATGALVVNVLGGPQPAAEAETATVPASVSVARQLGLDPATATATGTPAQVTAEDLGALGDLTASRAQREAEAASAAQAQAAADQAELDRQAAEKAAAEKAAAEKAAAEKAAAEKAAAEKAAAEKAAAEKAAAEKAAAEKAAAEKAAAEKAAAERAAAQAAAPAPRSSGGPAPSGGSPAPAGSFKDYALAKVGGGSQFSCLEALWGKESGWNPNAQNPRSTAYGIPQFLDSTWAGTGIAKTSDGYRQIDAGLIYIQKRYGSPCGAWSHSQRVGWY